MALGKQMETRRSARREESPYKTYFLQIKRFGTKSEGAVAINIENNEEVWATLSDERGVYDDRPVIKEGANKGAMQVGRVIALQRAERKEQPNPRKANSTFIVLEGERYVSLPKEAKILNFDRKLIPALLKKRDDDEIPLLIDGTTHHDVGANGDFEQVLGQLYDHIVTHLDEVNGILIAAKDEADASQAVAWVPARTIVGGGEEGSERKVQMKTKEQFVSDALKTWLFDPQGSGTVPLQDAFSASDGKIAFHVYAANRLRSSQYASDIKESRIGMVLPIPLTPTHDNASFWLDDKAMDLSGMFSKNERDDFKKDRLFSVDRLVDRTGFVKWVQQKRAETPAESDDNEAFAGLAEQQFAAKG